MQLIQLLMFKDMEALLLLVQVVNIVLEVLSHQVAGLDGVAHR